MTTSGVLRITSGLLIILSVSCAQAQSTLPTYPGTRVTKGQETGFVYFEASRQPCSLEPLTGEASVRGMIGSRSINGRFSFAAATQRLRVESVGKMPTDFVFTADEGTEAFLYRETYTAVGRSADVIETILGLPLNAADLRRVLTSCPRISGSFDGFRFDDRWFQVRLNGDTGYAIYAHRASDGLGWTIRAIEGPLMGTTDRWRAEFERDSKGVPRSVRVVSTAWSGADGKRFDVRMSLQHVRANRQLPAETFRIERSPSIPTTDLEGLQRSRPRSAPFLIDPRPK